MNSSDPRAEALTAGTGPQRAAWPLRSIPSFTGPNTATAACSPPYFQTRPSGGTNLPPGAVNAPKHTATAQRRRTSGLHVLDDALEGCERRVLQIPGFRLRHLTQLQPGESGFAR